MYEGKVYPGQVWQDTDGDPIQAHGGGILVHDGVFYWYGENKSAPTEHGTGLHRIDVVGVSCYSSMDLIRWKHEGVVLSPVPKDASHDLHPSKVVERPKVVYNQNTRKFVMWMHIDDANYLKAKAGVAISDSPTGPFEYLGSVHPNGVDSRDMTVFQDDDGQAYLIHSSDWNKTIYISKLSEDYLRLTGEFNRCFIDQSREAPAVWKHQGVYYMVSSGCTGWDPNTALYAQAHHIMGRWELKDNPCNGPHARKTFFAQSTFVLKVPGAHDGYIFMADQWRKENLSDSRYVWLPLEHTDNGVEITWRDEWDLSELG